MSDNFSLRLTTSTIIIFAFMSLFLLPPFLLRAALLLILLIILYDEWSALCKKNHTLFFLSPCYPILPFLFLIDLTRTSQGFYIFFLVFVFVSIFDTCSYLVGSSIGKTSIATTISPKKTWEGFVGGMLGLFIIAYVFAYFFCIPAYFFYALHIFFIGIFAFLGDLFESFIKRTAHVKDSGSILPGHGGLLDRFDSLLGAVCLV